VGTVIKVGFEVRGEEGSKERRERKERSRLLKERRGG
jgi:hypothetical protein